MSGAEPALIYGGLTAAEAASVASALTAAEAAAAAGGASAAAYGAGGAAAGGEAVSGAYGLTAAELASMEGTAAASGALTAEEAAMLANEGGGLLGSTPYGAGDTMSIANQPAPMSDMELYKEAAQRGFRNLGKMQKDMPPGASNMMMQGMLGGGGGQQNNVSAPRPQGPPANPQPTAGLLGASNQPLPKVTPYAPSLGGNDAEEMKRRLMLLMQGYA